LKKYNRKESKVKKKIELNILYFSCTLRRIHKRFLIAICAYNDLVETQFSNIVKLMSGLVMGDSVQEKVLKELSTNLAALMVVEN